MVTSTDTNKVTQLATTTTHLHTSATQPFFPLGVDSQTQFLQTNGSQDMPFSPLVLDNHTQPFIPTGQAASQDTNIVTHDTNKVTDTIILVTSPGTTPIVTSHDTNIVTSSDTYPIDNALVTSLDTLVLKANSYN